MKLLDRFTPVWRVRAAGLAVVVAFLFLVGRFWHPVYGFTKFLQLDEGAWRMSVPEFKAEPVYIYHGDGGYDGLYYAQIAYHPSLNSPDLAPAMDNLSYRARRILPPALAWLLAAGQPHWIVHVYSMLNLGAWLILAWLLWRWLPVNDALSWLAWVGVLFSAGALASVRLALSDLTGLTLLTGAIIAADRFKRPIATNLLAAAGLARETTLLGVVALARRPWLSWRNVALAISVFAPLAVWLRYLTWKVGPADQGWSNFTLPLYGYAGKWGESLSAVFFHDDPLLALTTFLALIGLTVQAVFFFRRWNFSDFLWRLGFTYAVFMLFLREPVWEGFPGAAQRVLLPLTLAFNVVVVRSRAAIGWLLLGNLAVFSGLLMLRDVPNDRTELGVSRNLGVAGIAHVGSDWFGAEQSSKHRWAWNGGRGKIDIEVWPNTTATVLMHCRLRSLDTRSITISQDGAVTMRATSGPAFLDLAVPVQLRNGRATVEFASDTPGVRSPVAVDPRLLAFAVYDVHFELPNR